MIKQPARLYTAVYGFVGLFQATLSYAFHFFPSLVSFPFLTGIKQVRSALYKVVIQ